MGRHTLPEPYRTADTEIQRSVRGRAIAVSTALVLAIGAGTVVAAQAGLLPFGDSCDSSDVERLAVVASPDVAPTVRKTADRARDAESDGRCLDVKVTPRPAAEVAQSLRSKGAEPDFQVWIPDSSMWTQMVTASGTGTGVDSVTQLASSPVGLAALPDAAQQLGWPDKTYDWAELTETVMGDESGLRVGSADPAVSATGALALSAIHQAGGGGEDAGTRTAATAKALSERVEPGDEEVLATLPDSGLDNPKDNQALILSEQAAYAHNTGDEPAPQLEMFYPSGGSVMLDYPYAVVDSESMPMDRVRAANRFQTLLTDETGTETFRKHGFRPADGRGDTRVVRAAGGREPQPYDAEPAEPPSVEDLTSILGMWTVTVQSARLTTVVDVSGSMGEPVPDGSGDTRMDVTKVALIQALAQFTGEDEIGLWRFSTALDGERDYEEVAPTERLADRTDEGAVHRDRLTSAFSSLEPVVGGATGLYDTALAAYRKQVEDFDPGRFNAMVLLTDGANEDPGSISRTELVKELQKSADPDRPVGLIAIAIGPDADKEACTEIAEAAGGASYQVTDPQDIHAVLLQAVMDAGSKAAQS